MNKMKSSVSSSFLEKEINVVVVDMSSSSSSLSNGTTSTLQRNTKSCSSLVNRKQQQQKKKSLKDIYIDERKREEEQQLQQQQQQKTRLGLLGGKQHVTLSVPPVTPIIDQLDSCSIDSDINGSSSTKRTKKHTWGSSGSGDGTNNTVYIPQSLIESSIVYYIGFILFIIAYIWPPLLLFVCIGIHKFIVHCFRENDFGSHRRQLFQQFITDGYESLPKSFQQLLVHTSTEYESNSGTINKDPASPVQIVHGYWKNSRGMQLHTITMTPVSGTIKAVTCVCHGYSDNFSYTKLVDYQRLVIQGNIAIVAIEYEGHGLSDGLLAYIEDFTTVIDDVSSYFSLVLQKNSLFQNKAAFLIGESMGGAIAYDVQNRIPNLISGVVLVCPMCKISDEMLPSPIVIDCLKRLLELLPWIGYLPLSPSKQNLDTVTYKVRSKYIEASMSPLNYNHPMRLTTARELLDATQRISETFYDFDTSFLIVHGGADVVTDPLMSQQLYDESKSIDKTIKIYDTMWHALTSGETDTDIDLVFNDIIQWIHQRIPTTTITTVTN